MKISQSISIVIVVIYIPKKKKSVIHAKIQKGSFFFQKHHMIRSWKWRVLRALCARACQPLRVRDRRPSHSYSKQKEDFFKYVHQFYFGRDAVF